MVCFLAYIPFGFHERRHTSCIFTYSEFFVISEKISLDFLNGYLDFIWVGRRYCCVDCTFFKWRQVLPVAPSKLEF